MAKEVLDTLFTLAEGMTMRVCPPGGKWVIFMDDGQIVEEATPLRVLRALLQRAHTSISWADRGYRHEPAKRLHAVG
jgi:hypothetical protein